MTLPDQAQYLRVVDLIVSRPESRGNNPSAFKPNKNIDLSNLRIVFRTEQEDVEFPNNCTIRLYNLAPQTIEEIVHDEFSQVVLAAGYQNTEVNEVFVGSIKQFRIGRESATDTYFELLCADGDFGYNHTTIATTVEKNSTAQQRINIITDAMVQNGLKKGEYKEFAGGVLPRGKVLFGMARVGLRRELVGQGGVWSIDNGRINISSLTESRAGEAIVLTPATGLIGMPEQTNNGVVAKCLLNPKLRPGSIVKLDSASINRLLPQDPLAPPLPFNRPLSEPQLLASIPTDGLYRVYVAEHEGDTRGVMWYTTITCLALNVATRKVRENG